MPKRHSDAIAISDGACNPSGICHSIIEACTEIREANGGTNTMCSDPAIRLMVYQLAFLVGFPEFTEDLSDGSSWFSWRDECRNAERLKP